MKEKEIILSSDNLTFEDEEVGSSGDATAVAGSMH